MSATCSLQLREFDALTHLFATIPKTVGSSMFSNGQEFTWTCVDVNEEYIAIGTSIGQLFLYDRAKGVIRHQLSVQTCHDAVSCVKMVTSVEHVIAVGFSSGLVAIFQLPSQLQRKNNPMQVYMVRDIHRSPLSCLEWSRNAMKLFSADVKGLVSCTEIDYLRNHSQSYDICTESHAVVQLDYSYKALLISTLSRSVICRIDDSNRLIPVGQTERKILGPFGAIFVPGSLHIDGAVLYASRPGLRLWKAASDGTVETTCMFRDQLTETCDKIALLRDIVLESLPPRFGAEDRQFGRVFLYGTSSLVTYHGTSIYVIDIERMAVVCYHSNVGPIVDVALCNDEIYVLRSLVHRPLIRLSTRPVYDRIVFKAMTPPPQQSVEPAVNLQSSSVAALSKTAAKMTGGLVSALKGVSEKVQSVAPVLNEKVHSVAPKLSSLVPNLQTSSHNTSAVSSMQDVASKDQTIVTKSTVKQFEEVAHSNIEKSSDTVCSPYCNGTAPSHILSSSLSSSASHSGTEEIISKLSEHCQSRENSVTSSEGPSVSDVGLGDIDNVNDNNPCDNISVSSGCDSKPVTPLDLPRNVPVFSVPHDDGTGEIIFLSKRKKKKLVKQVKTPDVPSTTSIDSADSVVHQNPTVGASVEPIKTENSTVSLSVEPITTELNIDLDLLRTDKPVLELLSPTISKQETLLLVSDVNGVDNSDDNSVKTDIETVIEPSELHTDILSAADVPPVRTQSVSNDDFYSIYSCKSTPQDPLSLSVSIEDAIHQDTGESTSDSISANSHSQDRSSVSFDTKLKEIIRKSTSTDVLPSSVVIPLHSHIPYETYQSDIDHWVQLPAPANVQCLTVSSRHIWCISMSDELFYSHLRGPGLHWFMVTTAPAQQISVSPSGWLVWRLDGGSVFAATNVTNRQPWGNKWVEVARDVTSISVDDNIAWYVKIGGEVVVQKGLSRDRPCYRALHVTPHVDMLRVIGRHGVVWGLTTDRNIVIRVGIGIGCEEGTHWTFLQGVGPGLLVACFDLGDDGTAWIMDVVGRLWFTTDVTQSRPEGSGVWWQAALSSGLMSDTSALKSLQTTPLSTLLAMDKSGLVSAGCNGIWICPRFRDTLHFCRASLIGHRWQLITPDEMSSPTSRHVCLSVVSCENGIQGSLWITRPCGAILCIIRAVRGTSRSEQLSAPEPNVACISLSVIAEAAWYVLENGNVYVRSRMQPSCPHGRYWQPVDMLQLEQQYEKLVHVSISTQSVWAVTNVGHIYLRTGVMQPPSPLNPAWLPVNDVSDGKSVNFHQVSTSSEGCLVWALDRHGNVYVREGVSDEFPCGTLWVRVPGLVVKQLTCSNSTVYALDNVGEVYVRIGVTRTYVAGDGWHKIPGSLSKISVSYDDELWGLDSDGQLLQRQVHLLERQPVLKAIVPSKTNNEDWVMV